MAREGPVLILKGNEPDALLMHLDKSLTETEAGMRPALAAPSLYNGGGVVVTRDTVTRSLWRLAPRWRLPRLRKSAGFP